jgi:penicillin-binding protein 2
MNKLMLRRVRIIFIAVIAVFILLSGRLAYLQILKHDYYWYRAEGNRFTKITLAAPRGEIFDRAGRLLVTNRPGFVVSLMDMGDGYDPETIEFLSEILEIDTDEIYSGIQGQLYMRYLPLRLKSDIPFETIAKISEHRWRMKGVNIEVRPIRDYRESSTAAHLFGYLGQGEIKDEPTLVSWAAADYRYRPGDLVGQAGIEHTWEPWLRGRDGEQRIETNTYGQAINYFERREPVPGHNLFLTMDLALQQVVEDALERRVRMIVGEGNRRAGRAAAVVLDPNSGAILAMASYPSYDLNTFHQDYDPVLRNDPLQPLTNYATQGQYPVGSTFKMVTGTAVLEEGIMRERDIISCTGVINIYNDTKSCYQNYAHGPVNFYSALAVSCNIYFFRAGLAAGIDNISRYAREYGFGSPVGLRDVPGEASGIVASREYKQEKKGEIWFPGDTMSAAIGQSYNSFTPLQLANYTAIIANGGLHYRPYLVERVADSEGGIVREVEPEVIRQAAISDRTISIVREAMRRVTQPGGTAWYRFSRLPVAIAGKTGSAEVADFRSGIPPHSLFTGYAPYDRPEIVVAVLIEYGGLGETGAVPVAAEIMEYYFTGTIEGVMDSDAGSPAD